MAEFKYLHTKDFNVEKLVFAAKKRTMIPIYYKSNEDSLNLFGLHTSELFMPFGCSVSQNSFSDFTEYYVSCALNNYQTDKKVQRYLNTIESVETKLKEHMKKHYSDYFSDPCQNISDKVDSMLTSCIKQSNKSYPPNMYFSIPRNKNGVFICDVYDDKNDAVQITQENIDELLSKKSTVKCAINCVGAWFRDGVKGKTSNFGLKWELHQAKVTNKAYIEVPEEDLEDPVDELSKKLTECVMLDDD
jgi:hypothetical protein